MTDWEDDRYGDVDVHVDDLRALADRIEELTTRLRDQRGVTEQEKP